MKAKASLLNYRTTGFAAAQNTAKDVCEEMTVEAVLHMEHWMSPCLTHWRGLKPPFSMWLWTVPSNLLMSGFSHWGDVKNKFGVLLDKKIDNSTFSSKCDKPCKILTCGDESDIDEKELAYEIRNLPILPSDNMISMELLSFIQEKQLEEFKSLDCTSDNLNSCCHCGFCRAFLISNSSKHSTNGAGTSEWTCND